MKSNTLRIEEDVKESVKRLARERGESLSGLGESYPRILTERSDPHPRERSADGDGPSSRSEDLGPVTRRIAGALGSRSDAADHGGSKEADHHAVVEAARRKHE